MKSYFTLSLALTLSFQFVRANSIDSLQNDQQVLTFLQRVQPKLLTDQKNVELRSAATVRKDLDCNGLSQSLGVSNWEKADFNGDGKTDLLVTLFWYDYGIYVVMDEGNGQFDFVTLSYNVFEKCELAKVLTTSDKTFLLFYDAPRNSVVGKKLVPSAPKLDTLAYQYGGFTEANPSPAHYTIDSLIYQTGYCYGSCPVFTIRMDKNGNATYEATAYTPGKGITTSTIEANKLADLFNLVEYIDVKKLNDNYDVKWTDDQTSWLTVKFHDGSFKIIRDYGLRGSFGLRLLYNKFFDLRLSQNWK